MTRIPEGMIDSAQEALSRCRQIGAVHDVDHLQMAMMTPETLDELVNHRLATDLVPYLVEMAHRGEGVVRQEYREPGALATTFRADVVAMSAEDYSHLCNVVRHMKQLNAEMEMELADAHDEARVQAERAEMDSPI